MLSKRQELPNAVEISLGFARQDSASVSGETAYDHHAPALLIEQKIREYAYHLWVREGRPEGRHLIHWDIATRIVLGPTTHDGQIK